MESIGTITTHTRGKRRSTIERAQSHTKRIMNEPSVDFVYPDDELAEEENHYREAARRFLRVMNMQADYVARADNKDVAIWATAYALGLAICEGISITDRACQLNVSPQALSKQIKDFQSRININTKSYTYGH